MPTNALLIRWNGGWHEVIDQTSIDDNGRREAMLSLGAAQSVEEVERIGQQHLALFGRVRTQITASVDPIGTGDAAYIGYQPGDTITVNDVDGTPTGERVIALTIQEDDDGNLTETPELKDLILDAEERFDQNLKKMTNGTFVGQSSSAQPAT